MKNFSLNVESLSQKKYFYPLVGVLSFVIINGILFGVLAYTNRDTSGEIAGVSDDQQPEEEKEATEEPEPTKTPKPTPTDTPVTQVTSQPSVKPTVTPTPIPSPTPTPYDKEEIRINSPEYGKKYDSKSITFEMEPLANSEVENLKIILNGSTKHTFSSAPYKKSFDLDDGDYTVKGEAKLKDGKTIYSGDLVFSVKTSTDPTPTPTATPEATTPTDITQ